MITTTMMMLMVFYLIQWLCVDVVTMVTVQPLYQLVSDLHDVHSLNTSTSNYTLADSERVSNLVQPSSHEYDTRSVLEIVAVVIVVVALSLVTCAGNLLVIISFKVDVQLQTVSNYFLLSLSVADLAIGLVSMPLYSVYLLMGYWPLGNAVCDAWLCLDYTMSNASVANLLVISFDRYFSVTRPLTYRVRRTSGRAAVMIAAAWMVSALLWTPWIIAWPYLEGQRTVPPLECYVQFLKTNKYFTIMTATAAFYLPVLFMTVLYFRIYRETEKRQKGLAELQGGSSGGSLPLLGGRFVRRCSEDSGHPAKQPPPAEDRPETRTRFGGCRQRLRSLLDVVQRRRQNNVATMYSKSQSVSIDGSCDEVGLNEAGDHSLADSNSSALQRPLHDVVLQPEQVAVQSAQSCDDGVAVAVSQLFRLPHKSNAVTGTTQVTADIAASAESDHEAATAPLISTGDTSTQLDRSRGSSKLEVAVQPEDSQNDNKACELDQPAAGTDSANDPSTEIISLPDQHPLHFVGDRRPAMTLHRVALQACMAAKLSQAVRDRRERKRHQQEKKAERKAARTLSAVLLAFIVTWTPYNVFIIVEAFCTDCVNPTLYAIGTSRRLLMYERTSISLLFLYYVLSFYLRRKNLLALLHPKCS